MSYHFRDRRRFPSKIANFSHPPCILRHAEGVLLGIGYRRWGQKIRTMGLPGPAPKFDDILCCLGTMHHRDRRTDRHRATAKTALSVRGKNYNNRISIGHHDVCATARDTRHTTHDARAYDTRANMTDRVLRILYSKTVNVLYRLE